MMRGIAIFLFFTFSIYAAQAQDIASIINSISKGKRTDTLITFNPDNYLANLPVTIIKGNRPGIVFTIVAGIHGYEYPPIIAVQRLIKEIDAGKLSGTLIILPIANTAAFYKRSPFVNPLDGKNLNTAFPGSSSGTATEQIAHWITKEIIPVSDVFLDIHGGDANEDLLPFICYYNNENETQNTEKARILSEASEMEYIVSYPFNISKSEPAKYAFKQAVQDGKVALSIEAGKLGTVQDENVALIKRSVYNMLNYSGIYKTRYKSVKAKPKYLYNQQYISVLKKGIFYSSAKSGDAVTKGQNLGYITDDFGNILENITAPVSGTILYKIGTPPVNEGETMFCIGY